MGSFWVLPLVQWVICTWMALTATCMKAWKDRRKEMGNEVNHSLQNILKLFVNLSLSGNQSRCKWGKKTEFFPSIIYVTNPKTILCRCRRRRPTIANSAVEYPRILTEMGHRLWVTDWGWPLCLTCLYDWYGLLQCVGVITLILTVKLIFRQSKKLQGLSKLLFFFFTISRDS